MRRIATTVVVIGAGGEKVLAKFAPKRCGHRTHGTFHLVENHALVYEIAVCIAGLRELYSVTLLSEIQWIQAGEEHGVQIDIQQIIEVFLILACERVGGPVGAGECVHERIE